MSIKDPMVAKVLDRHIAGRKVIVASNEVPFVVGELVRMERLAPQHTSRMPVVKTPDGREMVCFGTVVPYSEALVRLLTPMNAKEQYKFLSDMHMFICDMQAARDSVDPEPTGPILGEGPRP